MFQKDIGLPYFHVYVVAVYCKTCIVRPSDSPLKCQVCQNLHPSDFPKVCLELDKFLEENFSKEYTMRDSVRPSQFQNENSNTGMSFCSAQLLVIEQTRFLAAIIFNISTSGTV